MIDSMSTADVANAEHFERLEAAADARTASQIRDEFAAWLRTFFTLDPTRTSDLVLAINEALANCAEFAYVGAPRAGTMDLQAWFEPAESTIVVVIADRGCWRNPESPRALSRGRGIPLMEALADRSSIEASEAGTQVRLEWTNVGRAEAR